MKIVFVCTGNTCRSPMAQGLFRKILNGLDIRIEGIKVSSCGLRAVKNQLVSKNAVIAMEDYGVDISMHRAKPLRETHVNEADLLFTMTQAQAASIKKLYPAMKDNTFSLSEYAGLDNIEIEDPFGADLGTYKKCAADIYSLLLMASEKIIEAIRS